MTSAGNNDVVSKCSYCMYQNHYFKYLHF